MSRMVRAEFELRPWDYGIVVCHGSNFDGFCRYYRRCTGKDATITGDPGGLTCTDDEYATYVWVEHLWDIPLLAHELLHVVFDVMESRHVKLADESQEAFTYALGDLFRQILSCNRWRKVR